jgi:hypothetical protein
MQIKNRTVQVLQKATYTVTNLWTEVYSVAAGDFRAYAPEEGDYTVTYQVHHLTVADNNYCRSRLYINTNPIRGTAANMNQTTSRGVSPYSLSIPDVHLKAGEYIAVYAQGTNGTAQIYYVVDGAEGFIRITKQG